jgi:hypothetical protein
MNEDVAFDDAYLAIVGGPGPVVPRTDPAIAATLERNRMAFDLLRRSFERPYVRRPIDYGSLRPWQALGDFFTPARKGARLLLGDVIHSLATGNYDRAVEADDEIFQLAERVRDEPLYIPQFTRMAILGIGIHSAKLILAHGHLNDEEFERLDAHLRAVEEDFRLAPAAFGERAMLMTMLDNWSENRSDVMTSFGDGFQFDWWARLPAQRMELQADALRFLKEEADLIDKPGREGQADFEAFEQNMRSESPNLGYLVGAVSAVRHAGLRVRQQATNTRLAMRVDRFRAQHGRLPASLSEILDDEFSKIPSDLYGGLPVVYKIRESGFVIYSLGYDGIDSDAVRGRDLFEWGSAIEIVYPTQQPEAPTRARAESTAPDALEAPP